MASSVTMVWRRRSLTMSSWVRSKKPGGVERHRRRVGRLEDEELHLGRGVEGEALVAGALEVALEHVAGVALERLLRQVLDVAEHAGDGGVLAAPRHDLERARVGEGEHVRFLDPAVALDGRPVEGHALFEGGLELGRGDGEALQGAQDVGEPEADEPDTALFDRPQDVVELLLHASSLRTPPYDPRGRIGPETERSCSGNGGEIAADEAGPFTAGSGPEAGQGRRWAPGRRRGSGDEA